MPATAEIPRNQISLNQNKEEFLKILRARQYIYRTAVGYQIAQFVATVVLPILGAIVGLIFPDLRGAIASTAIVLTVSDVFWLDREMKRRIKVAARISEQFDCELLQIPWNSFVAGKRVDPQTLHHSSKCWKKGDGKLINWYSPAVASIALEQARLICQRLNLGYDSSLRRTYGLCLLGGLFFVVALAGGVSYARGFVWNDVLAAVLIPLAPLALWSIREYLRQKDAADAVDQIKSEADSFFDKMYARSVKSEDYLMRSREFQDAIFQRRSQNPLVAPQLYSLLRGRLEQGMNDSADEIVRRLGQADSIDV